MELLEVACVQRDMQMAKDGLIAYRTMTQSMKAGSLVDVTTHFRTTVENMVKKSKEAAEAANVVVEEVDDLENMDNPLKAVSNALRTRDTRERGAGVLI